MIYSVWEHGNRRYAYYQTPDRSDAVNSPSPKHLSGTSELGLVPDEAAWPLPSNAKLIGYGKTAKGQIASVKGGFGLGSFDIASKWPWLLAGAGAAWFFYRRKR